jgi:hypothetical protein
MADMKPEDKKGLRTTVANRQGIIAVIESDGPLETVADAEAMGKNMAQSIADFMDGLDADEKEDTITFEID